MTTTPPITLQEELFYEGGPAKGDLILNLVFDEAFEALTLSAFAIAPFQREADVAAADVVAAAGVAAAAPPSSRRSDSSTPSTHSIVSTD